MADPDFEKRRGPAFLPSVIFSFFTQNKGGGGGWGAGGPPGPLS